MDKQISELVLSDLDAIPVWYFPMDDTVEDETTIRPFAQENTINVDVQVIVKTIFTDKDNKNYKGYIYWGEPARVEYLNPVIYLTNFEPIAFWYGVAKPTLNEINKKLFSKFPINFVSEGHFGLKPIEGILHGLYYLDEEHNVACLNFN